MEGTVGKEKELGELEMLYDTLVEQMEEQDEIGRAKVKQLKRPRIEVIRWATFRLSFVDGVA